MKYVIALLTIALCGLAVAQTAHDVRQRCSVAAREKGLAGNAYIASVSECMAAGDKAYEPAPNIQPAKLTKKQADARIAKAQAALRNIMNDPNSAQFKDVKYVDETGAVCGMFNGKNSFGGYTPFIPFSVDAAAAVFTIKSQAALRGSDESETFNLLRQQQIAINMVKALCLLP